MQGTTIDMRRGQYVNQALNQQPQPQQLNTRRLSSTGSPPVEPGQLPSFPEGGVLEILEAAIQRDDLTPQLMQAISTQLSQIDPRQAARHLFIAAVQRSPAILSLCTYLCKGLCGSAIYHVRSLCKQAFHNRASSTIPLHVKNGAIAFSISLLIVGKIGEQALVPVVLAVVADARKLREGGEDMSETCSPTEVASFISTIVSTLSDVAQRQPKCEAIAQALVTKLDGLPQEMKTQELANLKNELGLGIGLTKQTRDKMHSLGTASTSPLLSPSGSSGSNPWAFNASAPLSNPWSVPSPSMAAPMMVAPRAPAAEGGLKWTGPVPDFPLNGGPLLQPQVNAGVIGAIKDDAPTLKGKETEAPASAADEQIQAVERENEKLVALLERIEQSSKACDAKRQELIDDSQKQKKGLQKLNDSNAKLSQEIATLYEAREAIRANAQSGDVILRNHEQEDLQEAISQVLAQMQIRESMPAGTNGAGGYNLSPEQLQELLQVSMQCVAAKLVKARAGA